jgi:hypothetical protein
MAVPYTFAGQTGPIPLTQLDINFANVKQSTTTAITVTGNAQTNINSVGVLTSLSVNGNVTSAGTLTTQGNITGSYLFGNGYFLTGISGGSGSNYSNANVAAFLPTYSGNISASNINADTLTTQGNITGSYLFGNGSFLTGISGGGSNYSNANVAAYLPTYSGNISAGNINVVGNITSNSIINAVGGIRSNGNIITTGIVSATGIVTTGILSASGNVFGNYLYGNGYFVNNVRITSTPSLSITNNLNVDQSTTLGGDTTIGGNLYVTGQVSIPGNINQVSGNSGQFFGNVQTGFGALYAGLPVGYANVPNDVFQLASNINDYAEMNFQNINGGNRATTDYVLTNDAGDDAVHFFNMGIASSTYDGTQAYNALGNAVRAHDGYLYVQGNVPGDGGNLVIGTNTLNQSINFVAGGGNTDNLSMIINPANLAGTVTVFGGISAAGNIAGDFLYGNGSFLTGIQTSYDNANVAAFLPTYTGALAGANLSVVGNATANFFIGNGSLLTNLPPGNYSNANVASYLPTYTGLLAGNGLTVTGAVNSANVYSNGVVSAVGNVTGNYFIGDGSLLANLPSGNYSNANVESYLPTYTGDLSPTTITTNGLTVIGSGAFTGNATVSGSIRSNNTISAAGNVTGANILSTGIISAVGTVSATGNIRGAYLFGNGFFLTGIPGGPGTGVTSVSAGSTVSGLTLTASPSTGAVNITLGGTAPTPTNMVTTNTAQTITAQKTFSSSPIFSLAPISNGGYVITPGSSGLTALAWNITPTTSISFGGGAWNLAINGAATLTAGPTNLQTGTDNTTDLGSSVLRWRTVFAANGTINTSDRNEKQQIRDLSVQEKAVGLRLKGMMKSFKFNDAVREKGTGARIHFGIIAQNIQLVFEDEGLDPTAYGVFCSDSWYEVDGKPMNKVIGADGNFFLEPWTADSPGAVQRTRLGVRYDELFALIIAALDTDNDFAARIAALEAKLL